MRRGRSVLRDLLPFYLLRSPLIICIFLRLVSAQSHLLVHFHNSSFPFFPVAELTALLTLLAKSSTLLLAAS